MNRTVRNEAPAAALTPNREDEGRDGIVGMIRAGIVGLGRMGFTHCATMNSLPGVEVVAVCEQSALVRGAIERYTSFRFYTNLASMLDSEELDCLVVTTPTKLHLPMVQSAINAGLHVFVEKPLCLSSDDAAFLRQAATEARLVNQVGYHNRFVGTFREARRLLSLSAIGPICHVSGESSGPVVTGERKATWRARASEGGGCLYDYASHTMNLLQYVVDEPFVVTDAVMTSMYSREVDDAVFAVMHFENGATGHLSANWSDRSYRKMSTQITATGLKGRLTVDVQELRVYLAEPIDGYHIGWNQRFITDLVAPISFYLRGEEYAEQVEYFVERIRRGDRENINSFETAGMTDAAIDEIKACAGRVRLNRG